MSTGTPLCLPPLSPLPFLPFFLPPPSSPLLLLWTLHLHSMASSALQLQLLFSFSFFLSFSGLRYLPAQRLEALRFTRCILPPFPLCTLHTKAWRTALAPGEDGSLDGRTLTRLCFEEKKKTIKTLVCVCTLWALHWASLQPVRPLSKDYNLSQYTLTLSLFVPLLPTSTRHSLFTGNNILTMECRKSSCICM